MDRKLTLLKYDIKEFSNKRYIVFYVFDTLYNVSVSGSCLYTEELEGFLESALNDDIKNYITWKPSRKKTGEIYIKLTISL